ncbi:hypothetical protein Tco_0204561 [Tanacetum coccineum]
MPIGCIRSLCYLGQYRWRYVLSSSFRYRLSHVRVGVIDAHEDGVPTVTRMRSHALEMELCLEEEEERLCTYRVSSRTMTWIIGIANVMRRLYGLSIGFSDLPTLNDILRDLRGCRNLDIAYTHYMDQDPEAGTILDNGVIDLLLYFKMITIKEIMRVTSTSVEGWLAIEEEVLLIRSWPDIVDSLYGLSGQDSQSEFCRCVETVAVDSIRLPVIDRGILLPTRILALQNVVVLFEENAQRRLELNVTEVTLLMVISLNATYAVYYSSKDATSRLLQAIEKRVYRRSVLVRSNLHRLQKLYQPVRS